MIEFLRPAKPTELEPTVPVFDEAIEEELVQSFAASQAVPAALHIQATDVEDLVAKSVAIKQCYGKDSPLAYLLARPHTITFTFTLPIRLSGTYFCTCTLSLLLGVLCWKYREVMVSQK